MCIVYMNFWFHCHVSLKIKSYSQSQEHYVPFSCILCFAIHITNKMMARWCLYRKSILLFIISSLKHKSSVFFFFLLFSTQFNHLFELKNFALLGKIWKSLQYLKMSSLSYLTFPNTCVQSFSNNSIFTLNLLISLKFI